APRSLFRNQRQPGASGPRPGAGTRRQGSRVQVHHLHRRAPSEASAQYALWSRYGPSRMAGARRYHQYKVRRGIRAYLKPQMKIISSKHLLHTPIFSVTQDHALDPDGFEIKRAIVRHQGSAVVMPVDERKRVLLVRQYRLPARRYLWELPAGR